MIFNGNRTGIRHNFTMDFDPDFKYVENIRGGIHCHMMDSKDFILFYSFEIKNAKGSIMSFNGQPPTLRLSIEEVSFF